MLGAAGCIAPEILASAGVIPQAPSEVVWFKSGVIPPAGVYKKGCPGPDAIPLVQHYASIVLFVTLSLDMTDVHNVGRTDGRAVHHLCKDSYQPHKPAAQ